VDEFQRASNEALGRIEITSRENLFDGVLMSGGTTNISVIGRAVQQVAKADPKNIQEVAASQLGIVNSYYQSGLQQSQQSFRWSLVWGGIGFAFLVVAVSVLLFRQPSEVAWVSVLAGAIIEVFAGTYLVLYKNTSDQLAAFRVSLEETQLLLLANSMCERLEGELEQTTRAEIIRQIVSSVVQGKQLSKEEERHGA
jgi:hypothetical protein